MTTEGNGTRVPLEGPYYVVGYGDAPSLPAMDEKVFEDPIRLRQTFIEKWSQPLRFSDSRLTAEEIEARGILSFTRDEPDPDQA